ncbi:hypothetical protein W97_00476 [Coniosporium apollinis CBS 100218]|uniref:t-SNARE coiled-coil homology domain-containing protein n=1 Tax=Coniosporium apollinis (strain CBS 100218) TaxID=1168221 RepID=R7YH95_CONA1|nr:uncharacterized protein W97_00476 [Coniosporium apollinis CBS 100218]EON61263.1 hypothetical protein W97_00476 [Coniosporium apollinis CBS 100218]
MSTQSPSQLLLLADHIKLSLLERRRAISLHLPQNSQDGQIARSLDQLSAGLSHLDAQLASSDDQSLRDQTNRIRQQYTELYRQFNGSAPPSDALTQPNDPRLSDDFAAAQTRRPSVARNPPSSLKRAAGQGKKGVRFTDSPDTAATAGADDSTRAKLFPYRDNPEEGLPTSTTQGELDNQQIHAYHSQVLREQDEQLDQLGESIGRQRELSMQIGDELDGQALLLDDVDEGVDRHQGQLDRAKKRLGRVGRRARENWSLSVIVVLIVILVLLIVILK